MYKAIVKYYGNHYDAGEEVKGSEIRTNEDGTVELFDDEECYILGLGDCTRYEWVEVEKDSVVEINE